MQQNLRPNEKLSAEQVATLKEVLQLSPSSFGLQPYKFVQVKDVDLRAKLREVSWGSLKLPMRLTCLYSANRKMDEAYVEKFIEMTAKTQGVDVANLDGLKGMIMGLQTAKLQKLCCLGRQTGLPCA
jgi:nitroreductase